MFHVGQKVARYRGGNCHPACPNCGAAFPPMHYVCTVISTHTVDGVAGLELAEFPHRNCPKYVNGHAQKFFRPVRETSIECFQSLLNPSPEDIERLREAEEEYVEW